MSEFVILDQADSRQIELADTAIKQSLAYDVRGKKQISFAGVKWLILQMSQKGQGVSIDIHDISLDDSDPENKVWMATVKAKNMKTGLETIGASEQPWAQNGKRDPFGRTKALSKAERNAYRKQIPELEIQSMLQSAEAEPLESTITYTESKSSVTESKPIKTSGYISSDRPSPPTDKQISYWKALGGRGDPPGTKFEMMKAISELKESKNG